MSEQTPPVGCVANAVTEASREAYWHRGTIADAETTQNAANQATASIIAAFLSRVPPGMDVGTLLVEVKEISNG